MSYIARTARALFNTTANSTSRHVPTKTKSKAVSSSHRRAVSFPTTASPVRHYSLHHRSASHPLSKQVSHPHKIPKHADRRWMHVAAKKHHGTQYADLQQTLSHLKQTTPANLDKIAAENQLQAGYKADKWEIITFEQLFIDNYRFSHSVVGLAVQSLVFGNDSIIDTALWDPALHPLSPEALELAAEKFRKKQIVGASTYFTTTNTFEQAAQKLNCDSGEHYHALTQVDFPRCSNTGNALFSHRPHLGIFHVQNWMGSIPIAVSYATENHTRSVTLATGETKSYPVGAGGAKQFFTTPQVLAALHHSVSRVIHQGDDLRGISKAERADSDGRIKWKMFGYSPRNTAKVMVVCPKGIAVPHDVPTVKKTR